MNIRFFESLCDSNKKVYDECYNLKKFGVISDFFIGDDFVKFTKDGKRPIKIKHPDDLYYYFHEYYDMVDNMTK